MSLKFLGLIAGAAFAIAAAGPAAAQTTIKLGHFGPGGDAFSQSVEAFAAELDKRSEGRLKVQIYPAGQLGNEKQQISALQGGLQEMLVTAATNLTNMSAPLRLLDLPFVFGNYAEADAVTTGEFGARFLAGLDDANLSGVALWENGFRVMTNNKHPIAMPDDLKGIAMRVIGAPVFIDTFTALGAQPVPMPFPELYSGLETGTVDGQDNTALTVDMMKYYEVQKYLTISNHMYSAMVVLAGKPFLDGLSPEDRQLLETVTVEFGIAQRAMLRETADKVVDLLAEKHGMAVIRELTPEQLAAFRAAVAPVIEKTVSAELKPLHQEMIARIEAAK